MFHVPELYRKLTGPLASTKSYGNNGCFTIPPKKNSKRWLIIIASDGGGWEHVSVHVEMESSNKTFTPYWDEMCEIKDMFWDDEDVVIQYHPAKVNYINIQENTLHLFRPINQTIPTPPIYMI